MYRPSHTTRAARLIDHHGHENAESIAADVRRWGPLIQASGFE